MLVSEKSHQNLSDYVQFFFFKKIFELDRIKIIISSEKMWNSSNYHINDYAQLFFGKDFQSRLRYWCISTSHVHLYMQIIFLKYLKRVNLIISADEDKTIIANAFATYAARTCLRMVPRTTESNYVSIIRGGG